MYVLPVVAVWVAASHNESIYSETEMRKPRFESQLMHLPALSAILDKALLSECQSFHRESGVTITLKVWPPSGRYTIMFYISNLQVFIFLPQDCWPFIINSTMFLGLFSFVTNSICVTCCIAVKDCEPLGKIFIGRKIWDHTEEHCSGAQASNQQRLDSCKRNSSL